MQWELLVAISSSSLWLLVDPMAELVPHWDGVVWWPRWVVVSHARSFRSAPNICISFVVHLVTLGTPSRNQSSVQNSGWRGRGASCNCRRCGVPIHGYGDGDRYRYRCRRICLTLSITFWRAKAEVVERVEGNWGEPPTKYVGQVFNVFPHIGCHLSRCPSALTYFPTFWPISDFLFRVNIFVISYPIASVSRGI